MSTELPKWLSLLPRHPGMSAPLPTIAIALTIPEAEEQTNTSYFFHPSSLLLMLTIGRTELEMSWYGNLLGKCCLQASSPL